MIKSNVQSSLAIAMSMVLPNAYGQLTPVIDGYAYELYSDITIDTIDNRIIINTNITGCEQPNGDPPLDTTTYTLDSGSQMIGLTHIIYNFDSQRIYFTSETSDLICNNGIFVDNIFTGLFEELISPFLIFNDGFD